MAMNMDAMLKITANVVGENNIRRLGNSMQGLEGRVKNASLATNLLYSSLKGLAALAVTGGVVALAKSAIDLADDMRDLSQRTGVSIESLGKFKVAAELSGSSLEGVATGLKFLNKNMVAAATGADGAAAAFKTVGVATTEADGTLRSADKVFLDVADRFKAMRDGPEKAALAMKIFGKAGTELIPILNLGSQEIQRFGLGIGPDFAKKADAFNDQLGIMKAQLTVLTVQIGSALLPVMSGLVSVVGDLIGYIGKLGKEFYSAIGGMAGLTEAAKILSKTLIFLGGITAGVFIVSNIVTFTTALRGVIKFSRDLLSVERSLLAVETARTAIQGIFTGAGAGVKGGATPAQKVIGGVAGAAAAGAALFALNKLIDDSINKMMATIDAVSKRAGMAATTPLPGTTPDLSALRTGDGGKKKKADDEAKRRQAGIRDSSEALKQSQADLAILKQKDPLEKIRIEYAEKRRALIAASNRAINESLSIEQTANIQRTKSVDIQKLQIEETNALTTAYKELKGAGFEAAMSGDLFYISVEKTTSVMKDFRAGIDSYAKDLGTLGTGLSNLAQTGFKGLEDAIVSMTTTGTFNFQQFALSIVEEMTRMVTRLMIIAPMLQFLQSLMPGAGLFGGIGNMSTTVGFGTGITGFAKGGIVNKPTMFTFADGGAGRFGLAGEAGPEAIMPLKRGRDGRLGIESAGGSGGVNVNVSVDASGSNVQGDSTQANALGKAIGVAVQQELIKQKRPGGLLA